MNNECYDCVVECKRHIGENKVSTINQKSSDYELKLKEMFSVLCDDPQLLLDIAVAAHINSAGDDQGSHKVM